MSDAAAVVTSRAGVEQHARSEAVVEGVYRQRDVRRMRADPDELLEGHVVIVLQDGAQVFLYPPDDDEALRSADEIERLEGHKVRVAGLLLSRIPGPGAAIRAPCVTDVTSIERGRRLSWSAAACRVSSGPRSQLDTTDSRSASVGANFRGLSPMA